MLETGVRQFRMAWSMVWGHPIDPRNLERLIGDALKTLKEFGAPGDDVQQLLEGPFTDPSARREFQDRTLQLTARRLSRVSPYYQKLFASHDINPEKLTVDDMPRVPVTLKQALQEHQQDFIANGSHPYLATRTTGTTGQPTEIWLSKYEMELWPALAALSGLLRNEINPQDCLQVNISSRATIAVQQSVTLCRLVGARIRVLGIIPPDESLDSLLCAGDTTPTLLIINPSYLAQLVQAARKRGLGPHDFRLRRIDSGGELLTSALARAAQETLGGRVTDSYGMTEILPAGGRVCNQGHLHHDLNTGFVEVIDVETDQPAAAGALGTLVITPYYPYRECMPVFRYDTKDIVRCLPAGEALTCELSGTPATSNILGKAQTLLRAHGHMVTSRDLLEVFEALPSQPWPARFRALALDDQIEIVLPEQVLNDTTKEAIERRFRLSGIELHVSSCGDREQDIRQLRSLRADLLETTFAARRN